MKIAVAGATGRVGHHVVDVLTERGDEVVPISRSNGVDVISGEGLDVALAGVDVIIDAATGPSTDKDESIAFFTTATRNLQDAGARNGARRLVVVSIIGIDGMVGGYAAAKLAHESAALAGPLPAQILRAAQFHEFVGTLVDWATRGDVAYVPDMRIQPVAARSVAEALADLAVDDLTSDPGVPHPEIAGPREESFLELATKVAKRRGYPLEVERVQSPDDPDAVAMETGALLASAHAQHAGPTFDGWLDATLPLNC